jgi:hypothetical protein
MALQSNADLCLLNRLLPGSSLVWPLFPVFNSASTNISLHIVPQYENCKLLSSHLITIFHCLGWVHLIWRFPGHIFRFLTDFFLLWQDVGLLPKPQPGGPVHHIWNPQGRVVQLYSQALGNHFSYILWSAWAAVGLFFSPDTTQRKIHKIPTIK